MYATTQHLFFTLLQLKPGDVKQQFPKCDICECLNGTTSCRKTTPCSDTVCDNMVIPHFNCKNDLSKYVTTKEKND